MTDFTERDIKLKSNEWIEQFDEAFLAELVDAYLDDLPNRLRRMCAALETGDIAVCSKDAHSLKSGSTNVEAVQLSNLARLIETAANWGNAEIIAAEVKRCNEEFARVKTILEVIRVAQNKCWNHGSAV